jgi:hypothetical protein
MNYTTYIGGDYFDYFYMFQYDYSPFASIESSRAARFWSRVLTWTNVSR